MNAVGRAIESQEYKDRYIAGRVMKDACTGTELKMWARSINDPVDVSGECQWMGSPWKFNLEIKERKKTDSILKRFPFAELRIDKYQRMRDRTEQGTNLLYMQLLNEKTCYLFNLDTLNWEKVETYNWNIKKTQMDYYSSKSVTPIYNIPLELAFLTMDCTQYYKDYYENYGNNF